MVLQKDVDIVRMAGIEGERGQPAIPGHWVVRPRVAVQAKIWDVKHGEDFIGEGYRLATFKEYLQLGGLREVWLRRDSSQGFPTEAECAIMKYIQELIMHSKTVGGVLAKVVPPTYHKEKVPWADEPITVADGAYLSVDIIRSKATDIKNISIYYKTAAYKGPGERPNPVYNINYTAKSSICQKWWD